MYIDDHIEIADCDDQRTVTVRSSHTTHPAPQPEVIEGDCIQVMSTMPSESMGFILTDPPYLARYRDRNGRTIRNDNCDDWLVPAFAQMYRLLTPDSFAVSFYGWHRVDAFFHAWRAAGFSVVEHLVFVKRYDSSSRFLRRRHEQAYLLAKGRPTVTETVLFDVMDWRYTGNKLHPTQKPVEILQPLIEQFSGVDDCVLDPFCGSASTLVAAHQAGRRSIGIELDADHVEVARQRLAQSLPVLQAA